MCHRASPDINDNEYRLQLAGHPRPESLGSRPAAAFATPRWRRRGTTASARGAPQRTKLRMFSRVMSSVLPTEGGRTGALDRSLPYALLVALLLALGLARSWVTTARDGFTIDEAWHAAAGASYARTGDYRLNPEHPPLIKLWVGAALVRAGF